MEFSKKRQIVQFILESSQDRHLMVNQRKNLIIGMVHYKKALGQLVNTNKVIKIGS